MSPERAVTVPHLPFVLRSEGPPSPVLPQPVEQGVVLTAGPGADMFLDPAGTGTGSAAEAERFVAEVRGDFLFSAFVSPVFTTDFDSGVLLGYLDPLNWFKICAELDTAGITRVVSVVTRDGASDDCDSSPMDGAGVFLRIARLGAAFALHSSTDGERWSMVRYFSMGSAAPDTIKVGLLAQSPSGAGTKAEFSRLSFSTRTLAAVRDGS